LVVEIHPWITADGHYLDTSGQMDIFAAENRLNQEFFANWWRRRLRQRIETDFVRFLVVGSNDLYWILVLELLKILCILSYNMYKKITLQSPWRYGIFWFTARGT